MRAGVAAPCLSCTIQRVIDPSVDMPASADRIATDNFRFFARTTVAAADISLFLVANYRA